MTTKLTEVQSWDLHGVKKRLNNMRSSQTTHAHQDIQILLTIIEELTAAPTGLRPLRTKNLYEHCD